MTRKELAFGVVLIFLFMALIPAMGNAESETITTEDLETPLKGEPKDVEIGQDGNLIIVTYTRHYGISLIHRNNDTIEHITAPDIESNSIYQMHYNEDDNVLFAVTGSGSQAYRTTLETIWLSNGTIQKIWLEYYANAISDLEYNSDTNTLYLACNDGLWIIDVGSQEIKTKLDKNSGLKPGGILDFYQEPTENLLWFATSWSVEDINIQTLDMSTNAISSEKFNVTDIANKSGYTSNGPVLSLLYDTTTRDIYVGFKFNETSTGRDYSLACFDRDDTSNFVSLMTGYLSQGKEITRSDDYQVFIAAHIYEIHPRNDFGDGPFFFGDRVGLFHYDTSDEKMSISSDDRTDYFNFMTFLEEVIFTSVEYDEETEEYIDVDLKFHDPEYKWIRDIAMPTDSTIVIITDPEGVTIADTDDMEEIPKPDPKENKDMLEIYHRRTDGFDAIPVRGDPTTITADGKLEIIVESKHAGAIFGGFFVGKSVLTVTDSKGNVVLTHDTEKRAYKVELPLSDLPSAEYTIRVENSDFVGSLVEYQETKFILDNPNMKALSDSEVKFSSVALPLFGGLCTLIVMIAIIAVIVVALSKKKKDKISKEE